MATSSPAPAPAHTSSPAPTHTPTPAASVILIPWDPDSPAHIDRMYEQRVACGWKSEQVESWRELQRSGKFTLQWVVLSPTDPALPSKTTKHTTAYPKQSTPLLDTATSLGGKPRPEDEITGREFMPVGHISLNTEYEEEGFVDPEEGLLFIATFWISPPLQSHGLGRASMNAIEHIATAPPLNARILALSTWSNSYSSDPENEMWVALQREPPKISNQDWYARRGYVVFKTVAEKWCERDSRGREWWFAGVFMRKVIA
ncbi:hypothetical protein ONS95_013504 [Cadophora gregata]|uniref:uncharacterized protein n=1 Tax=Cadophora gregata TaxID=51156 RepID=UPI0026DD19A1|nr:uncharacterized protein ONS95_013504 [Cadophora gregata]KAK0099599.1 hypothetical protein ONS96_008099 [Cadophora gregata f. sp. sojae]KAK0116490.1 hypothetical protein ONS95_013504 [Cadophora gregata]